jgi:putative ABC transport system permease protein
MLIAHQAVNNKINTVKSSIGNTVTIQPAGYSGFSQVNNALTTSQLSSVASIAYVTNVAETLTGRLTTTGTTSPSPGGSQSSSSTTNMTNLSSPVKLNSGTGGPGLFNSSGGNLPTNFSLPVSIVGTNDVTSVNGTALTISSGKAIDATKDTNQALVSTSMASKNNLQVGSTFTAYNTTLTVAGLFNASSTSTISGTVVVSLPTEQRLSGQSGDVTSATATVDSLDNLSSATTAIKNKLGSAADVTSSVDQANQTVQPLDSVGSISLYSLIGAVVAGSMIILLTMIMIVRERRREIGVIKAIGASNMRVVLQFMAEAVTFTAMAAVIGIVLGIVAGNPVTKLLVNSTSSTTTSATHTGRPGGFGGGSISSLHAGVSNVSAAVGWSVILYGLGAALIIALLGSSIASFFIAKIRPAEVMRAE